MSLDQFRPTAKRFLKFMLAGGGLFAANYLAFYLFVTFVPEHSSTVLVAVNFAIATVSLIVSYWIHIWFTFADQSPKPSITSFFAYLASVGAVVVIRNLMFASFLGLNINPHIAFIVSLIAPHLVAFLFYQSLVFNRGE